MKASRIAPVRAVSPEGRPKSVFTAGPDRYQAEEPQNHRGDPGQDFDERFQEISLATAGEVGEVGRPTNAEGDGQDRRQHGDEDTPGDERKKPEVRGLE